MTSLRQARWTSTLIVAVTMFAWLVASNHCAFAAFESAVKAPHACCHEGDEGKSAPPRSTQCCEAFNVPLSEPVAAPAVQLLELEPAWVEVSAAPAVTPVRASSGFSDTGPPGAATFAETVLNRSLLAHAPPRFVA